MRKKPDSYTLIMPVEISGDYARRLAAMAHEAKCDPKVLVQGIVKLHLDGKAPRTSLDNKASETLNQIHSLINAYKHEKFGTLSTRDEVWICQLKASGASYRKVAATIGKPLSTVMARHKKIIAEAQAAKRS